MTHEQRFLAALQDIFVGAKVEGKSGYINLMRIKAKYYAEGIVPSLKADIDAALEPFPQFREELFDKLYDFFHRYFTESGSIYFRHTPFDQNIYEKVYTNDKDVMLFWKTHMLYYVKTDRLFRSLELALESHNFFFDVSSLEHKKANEKRAIVYRFTERRPDGTLAFAVSYSEQGRDTKTADVVRALDRVGVVLTPETLERAFRIFQKQNEVDYFINKDAIAFLREQFNLWLYRYIFSGVSQWTESRIKEVQVLREIAFKIIAFIGQFESELVKIWNKPKFALSSNYVITLDRIADRKGGLAVLELLLDQPHFDAQIKEWISLGIVDTTFKKAGLFEKKGKDPRLAEQYKHLPVDTKHFKSSEVDILGLFDNLDSSLDGWLVKSENYQALRTLLPKFTARAQTIYIDPPFNTGDDFLFRDQFRDATWLTIMENRISLAKRFLLDSGTFFLHLDWNANYHGRLLLESAFSKDGFINEIVWRIGWVSGYKTQAKGFVRNHDTLFLFANNPATYYFDKAAATIPYSSFPAKTIKDELRSIAAKWKIDQRTIKNIKLTIKDDTDKVYKIGLAEKNGGYWIEDTWNCSEYEDLHSNKIKRNAKEYTPNGSDITQKPEQLLQRVVELATADGDLVLDFFAGTGTTLAAAHKLKRKWLGVELGSYFETDALYRMKHVLAGKSQREPVGISGAVGWSGGGFFKYYHLEQYEDALQRATYGDSDLFTDPNTDPYSQYVFLRDIKMLEALDIDAETNKVSVDLSKLYEGIDLAETLSLLTGKWIKRVTRDTVEFEDGEVVALQSPDWKRIKPLLWW